MTYNITSNLLRTVNRNTLIITSSHGAFTGSILELILLWIAITLTVIFTVMVIGTILKDSISNLYWELKYRKK